MAAENMWMETHKVLKNLFEVLTCKECGKTLSKPQLFLNCGHFTCAKCVGNNTQCFQCKMPGDVSEILSDSTTNDFMINLNIIADIVGFRSEKSTSDCSNSVSTVANINNKSSTRVLKKPVGEISKSKAINETLNSSMCGSTVSRSTYRGKANESIPKNINKKNKKGETALHMACRSNNIDRVKLLLEAGANPNTKDNAGWTPLQEAASYEYYNICEILLQAGASVDMHGYDNRTALHEAVIIGNCDIVSLFLSSNANEKVYDNVGKKPRDYCKTKEMSDLFKSGHIPVKETEKICDKQLVVNLEKSLNSSMNESKIVLYGSDLKQNTRKLLAKLCVDKKLRLINTLSLSATHVIIEAEEPNRITLTFDVLLTILYGKSLLSSNCLPILMDTETVTIESMSLFEVNPPQWDNGLIHSKENMEKQNPRLFNNCYFYFAIKSYESINYDELNLSKEALMKLVTAGDGIVLTREPKPEDIQGSLSPFHVAHNPEHSLHKCTHYIIYVPKDSNSDSNSTSNRIMYNMSFLKSLPLIWFIESILRFKLIDPIDMGLLTN